MNIIIDRLANEPLESYSAIQYYYKAGKGRTIHKAYQLYCTEKGYDFDKPELQMWITFSNDYNWDNRINERESVLENELNRYAANEQFSDLIGFRKRQSKLSIKLADTTELLLEKATEALLNLDASKINAATLPKYIEAAARISTLAQNAEAQVLALTDLITHLNEVNEDDDDAFISSDNNDDELEYLLT